ncbi:transporter [Paenibacillus silvisoli]|uniref:transporter n=1 Tax=Paenibacillus silvisoli TaxID=3110539 RepID=UPI002803BC92|nr:transporter [Paenibacillus silvisoli]
MPYMRFNGPKRQPPQSPPPNVIPMKPTASYNVDGTKPFTYVWLRSGESFWFYPTYVDAFGITGFKWNGADWDFHGFDPRTIDAVA